MHALRTELPQRDLPARPQPHYGLGLQIKTPAQAADPRRAGHGGKVRHRHAGRLQHLSFAHARRAGAVAGSDPALTALAREDGDLDGLDRASADPGRRAAAVLGHAHPSRPGRGAQRYAAHGARRPGCPGAPVAHLRHPPHRRELQPYGRAHRRAGRQPAQPDQRRLARAAHAAGAALVRGRHAERGRHRSQAQRRPARHARGYRRTGGDGGRTAGLRPAGASR